LKVFFILSIAWFGSGTGASLGLDKNRFKTSEIHRYSRNPQLVGYGLILIVLVLLFLSLYFVGWFIIYLTISYFMMQSEEEFLRLKYSEEYERNCSTVPRIMKLF